MMREIILNQRRERDGLLALPYLSRRTTYSVAALLANPLIKLITGPRRAGKSVFALLMLRGKNFAYLNFDDQQLLQCWDEESVMRTLSDVYLHYEFLMLDEVQNLEHWDLWVSKLYRRGVNLVVTGSNANMLSREMATVLTGRYVPIEMFPFSLHEALAFWQQPTSDVAHLIDDYLRFGGYPEVLRSRDVTPNYLNTLYDSILFKDVVQRHKIRLTDAFYNVAGYLLSNFCNLVSANDLADKLGLSSVSTAQKFMNYLHEPYLFYYLPRYSNKLKLMTKAARKIYVVDNGFVSAAAFNLGSNSGRLLENQVFVELLRRGYEAGKTLFYYRSHSDKEVDFVLRQGTKVEQLLQVCYDMSSEKTMRRELNALVECAHELQCDRLTVVTCNMARVIEYKGKSVQIVPIVEF
ncbi:MAG: ATP-binding protein [Paludibacteraceae bacterium]